MHLGSFPAPSVAIFVVILGLSFAVARLDFMRRRGKQRPAVRRMPASSAKSASSPPAEAPKVSAAEPVARTIVDPEARIIVDPQTKIVPEPQAKSIVDPSALKRTDRITRLPGTDRAIAPKLAYGHVVPLPMPAPKSPKYAWRRTTVTWWPQES